MKGSIWYHAYYDEIWIKRDMNRVERGCQATIKVPGYDISVPDHLSLFTFKVDPKLWKHHVKNGWLIKLEASNVNKNSK